MVTSEQLQQDKELFFSEAFKRNIGIVSQEDQDALRGSCVAVVGCGGVGGEHILNCVRLGIGKLHIADMDTFDAVNIQRQSGANIETLGQNKADVLFGMAKAINPHVDVVSWRDGVSDETLDDFLNGVDVLIDGIDFFCVDMRRKLFMKAREKGIYAVTAGPLGFGSALLVFSPEGMSFDDYFDMNDGQTQLQKVIAFAVGLAPAALHMKYLNLGKVDPKAKSGPALVSSCALCSAFAVTETIKILTKKGRVLCAPYYLQYDMFLRKYKHGKLLGANRHPWQKIKRWFLYRRFKDYEDVDSD